MMIELNMAEELIKTALAVNPGVSGGSIWKDLKATFTEEDESVRKLLKRMEKKGLVVSEKRKDSALTYWRLA